MYNKDKPRTRKLWEVNYLTLKPAPNANWCVWNLLHWTEAPLCSSGFIETSACWLQCCYCFSIIISQDIEVLPDAYCLISNKKNVSEIHNCFWESSIIEMKVKENMFLLMLFIPSKLFPEVLETGNMYLMRSAWETVQRIVKVTLIFWYPFIFWQYLGAHWWCQIISGPPIYLDGRLWTIFLLYSSMKYSTQLSPSLDISKYFLNK